MKDRSDEIEALLSDAETISNQDQFRELSKEYSELERVVKKYSEYNAAKTDLEEAEEMKLDADPDIKAMAEEEVKVKAAQIESLELELQKLLLPKDSKDSCNVFLEIRAGTGGDEAAIFFAVIYLKCMCVFVRRFVGKLKLFLSVSEIMEVLRKWL